MSKRNLAHFRDSFHKAAAKAGFDVELADVKVEKTKSLDHGHFACNLALMLAQKTGRPPRDVAADIVKHLGTDGIVKTEIAGPGFINVWVDQKFYTEETAYIIDNFDDYLREVLGFKPGAKTMVSDTSHPNIAKPMGVHHLLSTIIGAAINNLYRKCGYNVIADNYLGDMGTQFGKVIAAIKKWGNLEEIEKNPIPHLLKLYVQFHIEADKDVELDDEARAEYKKFEEGDRGNRELWKKIVRWSLAEIQPVYDRLGVTFDQMRGESFYEDKMAALLDAGRKSGVIVDGERGAWIIPADDPADPPTLVRKSDGASLYMTRDLAQTAFWENEYHPDLMVWVVDVAQKLHFRQRFSATRKLGLTHAPNIHVDFGRMQFKDAAMSTRKGNIIQLIEVLDEAEKRALDLVKEKGHHLTPEEQKKLARVVGVGAIKYNVLHQNRVSNITFDWDQMLTLEGNSAPYLMYTATRANSVLEKAGLTVKKAAKGALTLGDDLETRLAIQLMMFPEALARARDEFKPNLIANYLYELSQAYNSFYNALPILQADNALAKETRLLLTAGVVKIMTEALALLGLQVPEKM